MTQETHFRYAQASRYTWCGRMANDRLCTPDWPDVTCAHCIRSRQTVPTRSMTHYLHDGATRTPCGHLDKWVDCTDKWDLVTCRYCGFEKDAKVYA